MGLYNSAIACVWPLGVWNTIKIGEPIAVVAGEFGVLDALRNRDAV